VQRGLGGVAPDGERDAQPRGLDGIDRLLDRHGGAAESAARRLGLGRERDGGAALGAAQDLGVRRGGGGAPARHRKRAERAAQVAVLERGLAAGARGHAGPPWASTMIAAITAASTTSASATFHQASGTLPAIAPVWPLITTRSAGLSSR